MTETLEATPPCCGVEGPCDRVPRLSSPFTAELTVERYLNGKRIDSFLVRHFRNYSPFRMQRMVRAGQVRVNDVVVGCGQRVFANQLVTIRLVEPPDKLLEAESLPVEILYEDPWLVVINKPAGQAVHPAGRFVGGTVANLLQHYLDQQTPLRGLLRPGIVHRLDRLTSGLLLVTKEHLVHRLLTIQFQRRQLAKTYLALVQGVVEPDAGTLDWPIGRDPAASMCLMSAKPNASAPRSALTEFRVLQRFRDVTLVEAKPLTGRLHQIRVHLAELGHPIVDDEFYTAGGAIQTAPISRHRRSCRNASLDLATEQLPRVGRQALHAFRLRFRHPITAIWLTLQCPVPVDMDRAIQRLCDA